MAHSIVLEHHFAGNRAQDARSGDIQRQRVYIFPTRYGLLFGAMIVVMLIGGINYNNSMAYVLTFILGSLLLVGILHTYRNLAGLILSVQRPEPVFAGQDARYPVLIDNRGQPARISVRLQRIQSRPRSWFRSRTDGPGQVIDIPADSLHHVTVLRRMQHRGLVAYGRMLISTGFPLGLFRAWARYDIDQQCIVYPRPEGRQPLPQAVLADRQDHSGAQAGNDDFVGFRNYRPGDPGNTIAWKQYARERDLLVTRFQGQGSQKLMLRLGLVDHSGSLEDSLSQLCQWLVMAEQLELVYGLELGNFRQPPGCGGRHLQDCLEALARFDTMGAA